MPILKAVKVDDNLRRLILVELVNEQVLAGQQVVIPESIIVQCISDKEWLRYRELLSGITDDNVHEIR